MSIRLAASLVAAASLLLSACAAEKREPRMSDPSRFIEKSRPPRQSEGPDAPPPGTSPLYPSPMTSAIVAACFATKQAGSNVVVPDPSARRSTEALLGHALAEGRTELRAWIGPMPDSEGRGSTQMGGFFDQSNLDTEDKVFLVARFGEIVMTASNIEGGFFRTNDSVCAAQLTVKVSGTQAERICGGYGRKCWLVCDASGCHESRPAQR